MYIFEWLFYTGFYCTCINFILCFNSATPPYSCADPESFARGGPTLTCFFFVFFLMRHRIQIPQYVCQQWPASKTLFKWRLNGFLLACRGWPNMECWLGNLVLFQGIWSSIAMKPHIFFYFSGRSGPPVPPLDLPMI